MFGLFGVDYAGLRNAWTTPGAIEAANADGLVATPRAAPAATPEIYDQWAQGIKVAPADFGARNSPRAIYDRYINVHRRDFAWLRDPPSLIEAPERSTLLIAQMRGPGAGANTWTLVVAANGAELTKRHARPRRAGQLERGRGPRGGLQAARRRRQPHRRAGQLFHRRPSP